ncbi:MAG: hypothetical protein M0R33_15525 [Methylomonas sp.]|jgi:hypothetical protein|uniref:hypothetical protein n=1 Tax=Methylomonas sp. TaxID=418 RepID=UPI0025FE37F2|nr:hypothetical protein [Methylomonas sp.]MCK9607853.1 hypothetical protein [Methylomonas sp.]
MAQSPTDNGFAVKLLTTLEKRNSFHGVQILHDDLWHIDHARQKSLKILLRNIGYGHYPIITSENERTERVASIAELILEVRYPIGNKMLACLLDKALDKFIPFCDEILAKFLERTYENETAPQNDDSFTLNFRGYIRVIDEMKNYQRKEHFIHIAINIWLRVTRKSPEEFVKDTLDWLISPYLIVSFNTTQTITEFHIIKSIFEHDESATKKVFAQMGKSVRKRLLEMIDDKGGLVSPDFARSARALRSSDPSGGAFGDFFIKVHDEMIRYKEEISDSCQTVFPQF